MGGKLTSTVYLTAEDGTITSYGPGDTVPADVAKQITNPDVWEGSSSAEAPPARSGAGSGKDKWVAYAEANGVTVDDDATRDDVIAAVEAAGVPTE